MKETEIGQLIKDRRKELNMTSVVLANKIGVNQSTVSRWESGQIKDIKRAQIYLLSKYLYIPVETILGLSNVTSTENIEIVKQRSAIQEKLDSVTDPQTLTVIENFINAYCSTKKGN